MWGVASVVPYKNCGVRTTGKECGAGSKSEKNAAQYKERGADDVADDAASDEKDEEEAQDAELIVNAQSFIREQVAKDVGAIEGRQREKVECGKDEVEHDGEIEEEDERDHGGAGGEQGVADLAGSGDLMDDGCSGEAAAREDEQDGGGADGGEKGAGRACGRGGRRGVRPSRHAPLRAG